MGMMKKMTQFTFYRLNLKTLHVNVQKSTYGSCKLVEKYTVLRKRILLKEITSKKEVLLKYEIKHIRTLKTNLVLI